MLAPHVDLTATGPHSRSATGPPEIWDSLLLVVVTGYSPTYDSILRLDLDISSVALLILSTLCRYDLVLLR